MDPGMSLVENYILKAPQLLLYVGFQFIFRLHSHENEKVKLVQLHNSLWPQKKAEPNSMNNYSHFRYCKRFRSYNSSYPQLKNFRLNKGGLQRGKWWSFHLLSFPRLENQEVVPTYITLQVSLVGSNRKQLAIGQLNHRWCNTVNI